MAHRNMGRIAAIHSDPGIATASTQLPAMAGAFEQERACATDGAVERSRTSDLLITNQLLYQLSYNGNDTAANGKV